MVEDSRIGNAAETLIDVYLAHQLAEEEVLNHDGDMNMIVRGVDQLGWGSRRFVDDMVVVVNLGQRPASIATSQTEAVRSFAAGRQALLKLYPWLVLLYRPTDVVEKGLIQIANLLECVEEEAGMGYPRVLID